MLYHENVPSIEVDVAGGIGEYSLGVLDAAVRLPRSIDFTEQIDLLSLARRDAHSHESFEVHMCGRICRLYDSLRYFARFEIKLEFATASGVAVASRVLGHLLRDRSVTVMLRYTHGPANGGIENLSPLKFLRCRLIDFKFQYKDIPTEASSQALLASYKCTIEKGPPVRELRHSWQSVKEAVVSRLLHRDLYFEERNYDWLSRIDRLVYDCDELKFQSEKQAILKAAQVWNQLCIKAKRDDATSMIGSIEEGLKVSEAQYEEMLRTLADAEKLQ